MEIKVTVIGWLINALFILLIATALTRSKKLWIGVWCLSCVILIQRGITVGYMPFRNLFESFLWFPFILPFCTLFSARYAKADTLRIDAWLGVIFLFPVAFALKEGIRPLPPALQSHFFVPHVFSYMVGYVLMARATILSIPYVNRTVLGIPGDTSLHLADRSASAGFACITLGLGLGSMWGNEAWGGYWQWDPKEMWSLATWLVYVAYFHLRLKPKADMMARAMLWLGLLFIVLTVAWINLSKLFTGMHSYA